MQRVKISLLSWLICPPGTFAPPIPLLYWPFDPLDPFPAPKSTWSFCLTPLLNSIAQVVFDGRAMLVFVILPDFALTQRSRFRLDAFAFIYAEGVWFQAWISQSQQLFSTKTINKKIIKYSEVSMHNEIVFVQTEKELKRRIIHMNKCIQ